MLKRTNCETRTAHAYSTYQVFPAQAQACDLISAAYGVAVLPDPTLPSPNNLNFRPSSK